MSADVDHDYKVTFHFPAWALQNDAITEALEAFREKNDLYDIDQETKDGAVVFEVNFIELPDIPEIEKLLKKHRIGYDTEWIASNESFGDGVSVRFDENGELHEIHFSEADRLVDARRLLNEYLPDQEGALLDHLEGLTRMVDHLRGLARNNAPLEPAVKDIVPPEHESTLSPR